MSRRRVSSGNPRNRRRHTSPSATGQKHKGTYKIFRRTRRGTLVHNRRHCTEYTDRENRETLPLTRSQVSGRARKICKIVEFPYRHRGEVGIAIFPKTRTSVHRKRFFVTSIVKKKNDTFKKEFSQL